MRATATTTTTPVTDIHAGYNKPKLFLISVIALITAGVSFIMRASVGDTLKSIFFDPINPAHSAEMIGAVLGVGSLGFALTIAIGSPMLDFLGMGRLLSLSSLCFIGGTLMVDFADKISSGSRIYWVLWSGVLLMGVGWGLVETVINPLIAALYTSDKTARLNTLHAWWPGGLIIGGLTGLALDQMGASWQIKLGVTLLPALTFLLLTIGTKFPPTERAASGVPASSTLR